MEGALADTARWLDAAGVRGWAAGGAYPIVNTMHLLGLVMLVGAIGVVDLRVAGAWRGLPAPTLSRALTPVGLMGLTILVPTGVLLFAADGAALAESWVFRAKLVLIGAASLNAIAFHLMWRGRLDSPPVAARAMALGSIALWLSVGAFGRFIAYSA